MKLEPISKEKLNNYDYNKRYNFLQKQFLGGLFLMTGLWVYQVHFMVQSM